MCTKQSSFDVVLPAGARALKIHYHGRKNAGLASGLELEKRRRCGSTVTSLPKSSMHSPIDKAPKNHCDPSWIMALSLVKTPAEGRISYRESASYGTLARQKFL